MEEDRDRVGELSEGEEERVFMLVFEYRSGEAAAKGEIDCSCEWEEQGQRVSKSAEIVARSCRLQAASPTGRLRPVPDQESRLIPKSLDITAARRHQRSANSGEWEASRQLVESSP